MKKIIKKIWLNVTSIVMCFLLVGSGIGGMLVLAEEQPPDGSIPTETQDSEPKIDSLLEAEIEERPADNIPIIIVLEPGQTITLPEGVKDVKQLDIINAIAAKVPAQEIAKIAALPQVEKAWLDREIKLIEPIQSDPPRPLLPPDYGDGIIGAPALWDADPAIDGTGIKIAILDTGIDKTRPGLGEDKVIAEANFTGRTILEKTGEIATTGEINDHSLSLISTHDLWVELRWTPVGDPANDLDLTVVGPGDTPPHAGIEREDFEFVLISDALTDGTWTIQVKGAAVTEPVPYTLSVEYDTAQDVYGHGTHVAGIAAGDYNSAAMVGNATITVSGVAPGASLLNAKVLDDFGMGFDSWIITGIEWSVAQGADILNLSLGYWGQFDGTGRHPLELALTEVVEDGVIVVNAAGNSGPGEATIGSPAAAYGIIAVAASDSMDFIAGFSSRGPTGDGRIGIDVAAPGVGIIAPVPTHVDTKDDHQDGYAAWSGTSMAAPHVAGAAALLLQAHFPLILTPEEVERALKNTADDIDPDMPAGAGIDILKEGAGRINVKNAHDALVGGILVDDEWFAGRVVPGDYTKEFTVINNSAEDVTLSITETVITDTQEVVAGDWLTAPETVTVPAREETAPGTVTFDVTMNVPTKAVGTYVGSITFTSDEPLTDITIPVSVNVMQLVDATTVTDITGTVDEPGDSIFYTLDVKPGLDKLSLRLDWSDPNNGLNLLLFNPEGEIIGEGIGFGGKVGGEMVEPSVWEGGWNKPETIEAVLPQEGKWMAVIETWGLETPEETYTLRVAGALYLELGKGWNIMSTPVALDSVMDTWGEFVVHGDGLAVDSVIPSYYFDGRTQLWHPVLADYQLKAVDAIYVKMNEADIAPIVPSPLLSVPTKELRAGWNLIGLANLEAMKTDEALTSVYLVRNDLRGYSKVVSPPLNQEPWIYIRDVGTPPSMEVGKGYWVFMTNPGTLAGFVFTPIMP